MTTKINNEIVHQWAAGFCGSDIEAFKALIIRHVSDRTVMPESEREMIEAEIAAASSRKTLMPRRSTAPSSSASWRRTAFTLRSSTAASSADRQPSMSCGIPPV